MVGKTDKDPDVGNVAAFGCNVAYILRYSRVAFEGKGEVAALKNLNVRLVSAAEGGTVNMKLDRVNLILSV